MYEFTDEFGTHQHSTLAGPPYDPKKPLTCQACCVRLWSIRDALVVKYGFDSWPESCSVAQIER